MADLKAFAEQLVNLTVKEVNELAEILKTEYGIETPTQLRDAVLRTGGLDVSVFCAQKTKKECKKNERSIQPSNA